MRMAPILATVLFVSAASAQTPSPNDDLANNRVVVPVGETKGAVTEGALKGAVVTMPRPVGAIGTTTGQTGQITQTPAGLERFVGAKVMIDHDGKGIVSEAPPPPTDPATVKKPPPGKDAPAGRP
jgi:hypothetical protein